MVIIAKFFDKVPKLFVYKHYENVLNNLKELLVEENIVSEVKVYNIKENKSYVDNNLLEVPCLVLKNNYYYKDVLLNKEKLREVLLKNAKS